MALGVHGGPRGQPMAHDRWSAQAGAWVVSARSWSPLAGRARGQTDEPPRRPPEIDSAVIDLTSGTLSTVQ